LQNKRARLNSLTLGFIGGDERGALANDVEDREEAEPVLVAGEDVSVIVAPQDHVTDGPGYVDSALLGHAASITRDINFSIPGTHTQETSTNNATTGEGDGVT